MGMHEDLIEAARIAVDQTVAFIAERTGLSRGEAYQLSSLVADFRITQLVERMVGVHAMILKAILGRPSSYGNRISAICPAMERPRFQP